MDYGTFIGYVNKFYNVVKEPAVEGTIGIFSVAFSSLAESAELHAALLYGGILVMAHGFARRFRMSGYKGLLER